MKDAEGLAKRIVMQAKEIEAAKAAEPVSALDVSLGESLFLARSLLVAMKALDEISDEHFCTEAEAKNAPCPTCIAMTAVQIIRGFYEER